MKPTIPGFQNSWQPTVYPLPQQAPAAPPGLGSSSVYQFGSGQYIPNAPLGQGTGKKDPVLTHVAQAPQAPAAPGYLGPASAMAYQMAGPRVGFAQSPQAPPPFDPLDPNFNPAPQGGGPDVAPIGSTPQGAGALLQNDLNRTLTDLSSRGVPVTRVSGTRISSSPGSGGGFSNPFISTNLSNYTRQGFAGPMTGGSGLTLSGALNNSLANAGSFMTAGQMGWDTTANTTGFRRAIGKLFGRAKG